MKELLQKLVETDDRMERMTIVEELMPMINDNPSDGGVNTDELSNQIAELQATVDQLNITIKEKDDKYINTFFNGKGADEEPPKQEETKEEKKTMTLEELANKL